MKPWILLALSSVCLLTLPACDDPDDPASDPGTAPSVSDLLITTDVSAAPVGASLAIDGTLTVEDPDGDVNQLRITVNLPDGSAQELPANSVSGTTGMTAFSIRLAMILRPPVAGDYRVDVRVDDDAGNLSNPVSFVVTAQ